MSEESVRVLPTSSCWLFLYSKKLLDVLGEIVINLIMAWYGLLLAGCRITVDIMPPTMPHQHTACPFKLPDQLSPPHRAISFIS
jgi:hypothetical protein